MARPSIPFFPPKPQPARVRLPPRPLPAAVKPRKPKTFTAVDIAETSGGVARELGLTPSRIDAIVKILQRFPPVPGVPLPRPAYSPREGENLMLAVHSMQQHMTDEGWLLQEGIRNGGYVLCGKGYRTSETDAIRLTMATQPSVVVLQDKREWDRYSGVCYDPGSAFTRVPLLADVPEVFRVGVLKDLLYCRDHTRNGHDEFRPHAVVHYYHPSLVRWLAPWLADTRLIRTYHCINAETLPPWKHKRERGMAVFSGFIDKTVYPLRSRLTEAATAGLLPGVYVIPHPGYGLKGPQTGTFLQTLTKYRVSICTTSVMGFTLRKLLESTAAGCRVITDLPVGDTYPGLEKNFYRVSSDASPEEVQELVAELSDTWDEDQQRKLSEMAKALYDYRRLYGKLVADIETVRRGYNPAVESSPSQESEHASPR